MERVGINCDDARIPDNEGNSPVDAKIFEDGDDAYLLTLPIKAMVKEIQAAGVPASVSNTLQGKCGFSVEKILLWCRLLNIPTDRWESYFVTTVDRQKVYDHLQGLC